jgi:hypothetical protein
MLPGEHFAKYCFHPQDQAVQEDWLILKVNTTQSVETSEATHRKTHRHILVEPNFQQRRFESLKPPPFDDIDNKNDDALDYCHRDIGALFDYSN